MNRSTPLLLFLLGLFIGSPLSAKPRQRTPNLKVTNNVFSPVHMGEIAKVTAMVHNHSRSDVQITRVKTSCGCTTSTLEQTLIPAGGQVPMKIEVDTKQKLGVIRKSIRLYADHYQLPATFMVEGEVLALKSKDAHQSMDYKNLFVGKCATCHTVPTQDLHGRPLYLAACATCHGTYRQGGHAPPLPAVAFAPRWLEALRKGRGTMPGFHQSEGGPLNEMQIKSLEVFLKQAKPQPADHSQEGLHLYRENCSPCHGLSFKGPIGPEIGPTIMDAWDRDALKNLLMNGGGHLCMPPFLDKNGGSMSEAQIDELVKFLK